MSVPFWWDRDKQTLIGTILDHRPDLKERLSEGEEQEKEGEKRGRKIEEEFNMEWSNWHRMNGTALLFPFFLPSSLFFSSPPPPPPPLHIMPLPSLVIDSEHGLMLAGTWSSEKDPTGWYLLSPSSLFYLLFPFLMI